MKKSMALLIASIFFYTSYSQGVQLYLGARGGVGEMLTHDQLSNANSADGFVNLSKRNNGWSTHAKAEALLGFGRLRVGYQFLYNFSSPSVGGYSITPTVDGNRYTTYFNSSKNNFFGHYVLIELALINGKHFALVPGVAVGSFTGYKIDHTTDDRVRLSETTHHRFSIGAELNAEIKFAERWTFLVSPNYYLFSLQDKSNSNWHEYLNFIGVDVGLRVNLL